MDSDEITAGNIMFMENSRKVVVFYLYDFMKLHIVNWAYNRPYDAVRIPEIVDNILNRKPILDGLFYLNYNATTKDYEIIDGIHRFQAIKTIIEQTPRCDENEWFFTKPIICNIYYMQSKGQLYDLFETINKSIAVPEIYIRDENLEKKNCIYGIVEEWFKKYRVHSSINAKYNIPNMNRDIFIDFLSMIYDKYGFKDTEGEEMGKILKETNTYISKNIPLNSKLSPKILEKCYTSGCYLFIKKLPKIETDIAFIIKEKRKK
jgi:hypothetical protein